MSKFRKVGGARTCFVLAATAATVGALGSSTAPALADTDDGTSTANVEVSSTITLTDLTPSFTLTGWPGSVPTTGANPVTLTVTTNNFAGYNVTVVPATANLVGAIAGNTNVIPANTLEVNGPAQGGAWTHLAFGAPLVVATKASASAEAGDSISNAYRLTIPFVRPDTYSGTLNYVATTL